jgi:hypothetical protein
MSNKAKDEPKPSRPTEPKPSKPKPPMSDPIKKRR